MKASVSQIKAFKACRRSWYFKWHEKLEPVQMPDSLQTGRRYHAYLEMLENGEDLPEDLTKECAMAWAFKKYILPQIKVVKAEQELEKQIGDHTLHGFLDGIAEDGCVVEHKTTSRDISEGGEYEYGLLWDEQIIAYMSLTGARKVYYTVIKKPTIRLKKGETEEEFFHRMIDWYDEETDQKIRVFTVERTDAEVAQFERDFEEICAQIQEGVIYKNTCNCNAWGRRCEYSSICLHYDPTQNYIEFAKKEDNGNETEND